MKTSTRPLRRLVRNLGLALAVAAVAAPVAQAASSDDYGIESFRVPAKAVAAYDAIETQRVARAPVSVSFAHELGRAAEQAATQHRYDETELVRRGPSGRSGRLPYDGIELVRARPSGDRVLPPYDGIEVVRSASRPDVPRSTVVSTRAFDWADAATGAGFGLAIALVAGSAAFFVARRRSGFAPS